MKNSQNFKVFKKSFSVTLIILICLIIGVGGICKAYENTVRIAFGEYKKAFGITSEGLQILDFEIKF